MPRSLSIVVVLVAAGALALWWNFSHAPTEIPPGTSAAPAVVAPDASTAEPEPPPIAASPPPSQSSLANVRPATLPQGIAESGPTSGQLWGVVVDAGGQQPVAGAEVELQGRDRGDARLGDSAVAARALDVERTATDREGRFVLPVPPARAVRVVVRADGYVPETVPGLVGGMRPVIRLRAAACTVEGLVTAGGRPVAAAEIQLRAGSEIELACVLTDAHGAFRIERLPAGRLRLLAASPQHQPVRLDLQLEPGPPRTVQIDLPAGDACRGRVLDADTSMPIEGAEVADTWSFHHAVRTDADGLFDLRGLDALTTNVLYVRAHDHVPTETPVQLTEALPIEIRLPRGVEVVGRFVDTRGRSLPQVQAVTCSSFSNGRPSFHDFCADWLPAVVADDGRFRVPRLARERDYWLYAHGEGLGAITLALSIPADTNDRFDIGDVVLEPAARIEGAALDVDGAPRVVRVQLMRVDGDFGRPPVTPGIERRLDSMTMPTDDHGRFHFTDLAAGWYELTANSAVNASATLRARVHVRSGEQRDDVVLTRRGIAGYLSGPWGRPASGHVSLANANGQPVAEARSDEGGWFWFDVGPDFRGVLQASGEQNGALLGAVAEVVAGQEVHLQLRPQ